MVVVMDMTATQVEKEDWVGRGNVPVTEGVEAM